MRSRLAAALALLLVAPALRAQAPLAAQRQLVTIQPLSTVAGLLSGDYEHAVGTSGLALGVGVSYFDDHTLAGSNVGSVAVAYASAEAKARYYLSGRAFHGFSAGVTLGGTRAHATDHASGGGSAAVSGIKLGTELDYTWLLGRQERFAVAAGLGAKRIFYSAEVRNGGNTLGDAGLNGVYPTLRLAIGWAF